MKLILKGFLVLVLLFIVLIAFSIYYLDSIIKEAVVRIGPEVTGTSVQLDSVDLSILSGSAEISGLAIGNPVGFERPNIFSLDVIAVDIDLPTINQDVVVIKRIYIDSPEIDYESTGAGDNFQALLENIAANTGPTGAEEETQSETEPKKIIIDEFVLSGGRVAAKHELLQGKTIDVPLPRLELSDIGRKTNGATAQEVASQIFEQVSQAAISAMSESALIQAAQQEVEKLKAEAVAEVEQRLEDVEAQVNETIDSQLNDSGLQQEQQEAIKGLIRGLGN